MGVCQLDLPVCAASCPYAILTIYTFYSVFMCLWLQSFFLLTIRILFYSIQQKLVSKSRDDKFQLEWQFRSHSLRNMNDHECTIQYRQFNIGWSPHCSIFSPLGMCWNGIATLPCTHLWAKPKTRCTVTGSHGLTLLTKRFLTCKLSSVDSYVTLSLSLFLALGSDTATQSTVCQKSWNEEAIWTRGKTSTPSFPGVLEMFHFPPETQMEAFQGGFARFSEPPQSSCFVLFLYVEETCQR